VDDEPKEREMSLFEQISSMVGSQLKGMGGDQVDLVSGVLEMFSKGGQGGLAGLAQAAQSKGLGDIVSSWIGTGANAPISASQIKGLLGEDGIGQLAGRVGLTPDALGAKLAELLPGAVDKLTPEGKIPDAGMLDQILGMLKSKLS
jgi:uncharacterized protein YidB (DUF937 family)